MAANTPSARQLPAIVHRLLRTPPFHKSLAQAMGHRKKSGHTFTWGHLLYTFRASLEQWGTEPNGPHPCRGHRQTSHLHPTLCKGGIHHEATLPAHASIAVPCGETSASTRVFAFLLGIFVLPNFLCTIHRREEQPRPPTLWEAFVHHRARRLTNHEDSSGTLRPSSTFLGRSRDSASRAPQI